MIKFLLSLTGIWIGAVCSVRYGRLPASFGMRLALCLTLWTIMRDDNKICRKKLENLWKRGCCYWQLTWMRWSQAVFADEQKAKERYDAIGKQLSEKSIRQWIMDELQKEVKRHGVGMVFMFSDAAETEKRLKQIAMTTDYYTVDAVETYLRKDYPQHFAATVALEFFPRHCLGKATDAIWFFPQNIKSRWMFWDWDHTFNPESVVKAIVRHEARHYLQHLELRRSGGASLVERIYRRKRWLPYGMDVLESDAFRYQFDSERGIGEFLEEALIEAA